LKKFDLGTVSYETCLEDEFGWTKDNCKVCALDELWEYYDYEGYKALDKVASCTTAISYFE
jgi:hypothetical protein